MSSLYIQIPVKGKQHLGKVIGTEENKKKYISNKIAEWTKVAEIATTHPQAVYTAYVKS